MNFKSTEISIKELLPPTTPASYYFNRFKQGATIVPRFMWFVEPAAIGELGVIDRDKPSLKTDSGIDKDAKEPWKGNRLEGAVEAKFLRATLLTSNLIPFGYIKLHLSVLPLTFESGKGEIVTSGDALKTGCSGAADWFAAAEQIWNSKKKKGTEMDIYERLNYERLMTAQHPTGFYNVLYNTSGTNLTSCVIDKNNLNNLIIKGLATQGFIAESVTYQFQTESEEEAHYLCAILNSSYVNSSIKPQQPRGTWGPRHIHRRPFEVLRKPISKFNTSNELHLKLAKLSQNCHKKVTFLRNQFKGRSIGYQRNKVREAMSTELAEIDKLVKKLLK